MDKLQLVRELLFKRRDVKMADLVANEEVENEYFDVDNYADGNIDTAFQLGRDTAEAELVEDIIKIIGLD